MAFRCPVCSSVSRSRHDELDGYCGRCHARTGDLRTYRCPACPNEFEVPPGRSGPVACGNHNPPEVMTLQIPSRPGPGAAPWVPVLERGLPDDPGVTVGEAYRAWRSRALGPAGSRVTEEEVLQAYAEATGLAESSEMPPGIWQHEVETLAAQFPPGAVIVLPPGEPDAGFAAEYASLALAPGGFSVVLGEAWGELAVSELPRIYPGEEPGGDAMCWSAEYGPEPPPP